MTILLPNSNNRYNSIILNEQFVFVDIETNGGNGPRGRVIEVAAIKVHGGEIIDTYQTMVNPGGAIPH